MLARVTLFAAVALATLFADFTPEAQAAGPRGRSFVYQDNFTENHGTISSGLYPSPLPVPRWVGHTYYTYQPFYPHNHLWSHYDVYRKNGTTTRAFYW
jgi:hypothetical protein